MMVECYLCNREYLTEADPHAFIFVKGEWKNNCGCYFIKEKVIEDVEYVEFLEKELEELKKEAATYKAILNIKTNKG